MIIVLKPHASEDHILRVEELIKKKGLEAHIVRGEEMTIIGCIGDTTAVDPRLFEVDSRQSHACPGALQTCKPCFPSG